MSIPASLLRRPHRLAVVTALALAALVLVVSSSAGDGAAANGAYVGRVTGSAAYLALITDGERVSGYVCDGRRVSTWLRATAVGDGEAALVTRAGRVIGRVSFTRRGASGELRLGGATRRFELAPARGRAGLYRARVDAPGGTSVAGWIVLGDGRQVGAESFISMDSVDAVPITTAAPRLDTATLTVTLHGAATTAARLTQP